jgi:hypothetical protein
MRNVLSFKVLFLTIVFLGTFAGPSLALTFSGSVSNALGFNVSGATVRVEDNAALSTTTMSDGTFSLSGLPSATDFILMVSKTGYLPVYTSSLNLADDIENPSAFVMFKSSELSQWGVTPGKGAIMAQVMDLATRSAVSGAVVTATGTSKTYPVTYLNVATLGGSSTYSNGVVVVLNVDDGDTVTLHATKSGSCFLDVPIRIHGDSVGETILLGGNGICYSGTVQDSSGVAAAGATVELVGNSAIYISTNTNGTFTLPGLPSGTNFSLKAKKTGYLPAYTSTLNSTTNIVNSSPLVLFTSAQVAGWGVTSGKGAILIKVTESANGSLVSGVAVTASSSLHSATPYPVTYFDGTSFGGNATYSNGAAYVLNVDPGDTVTLHAAKTGWSFPDKNVYTHADSVSEALIPGTAHQRMLSITVPGGGTGGGTVTGNRLLNGSSVAISCNTNCSVLCDNGTTVILHQDPAEYSVFTGWAGCDSVAGTDCSVTMNSEKNVTAVFNFNAANKVRRDGAISSFYSTISDAYLAAANGDTLRAWEVDFSDEDFTFNLDKAVILKGGYDGNYEFNNGYTTLHGIFSILRGSFTAENLVIR